MKELNKKMDNTVSSNCLTLPGIGEGATASLAHVPVQIT